MCLSFPVLTLIWALALGKKGFSQKMYALKDNMGTNKWFWQLQYWAGYHLKIQLWFHCSSRDADNFFNSHHVIASIQLYKNVTIKWTVSKDWAKHHILWTVLLDQSHLATSQRMQVLPCCEGSNSREYQVSQTYQVTPPD